MRANMPAAVLLFLLAVAHVAATPAGFSTFFESDKCPEGWAQLPTAKGRLVISVADAADAGVTVNKPLADQEDRPHVHPYSSALSLPSRSVAAIDCCNDQAACNGDYPINSAVDNSTSGLPFVQLLLCTLQKDTTDPVPFGTIAFFEPSVVACPDGFSPFSEAAGRALIPGYSEKGVIPSDAHPLSSGEDRPHAHVFNASIATNEVSFAGVVGCCNGNPAGNGVYEVAGTTASVSSGIPYIQLLTCVSQQATFASALPTDALIFNEVGCPPGWNVSYTSAGRFVVALPDAGVPGATFGGASLKPGFAGDVDHSHSFSGTVTTRSCGVGLASGCCGGGYAGNGQYSYRDVTAQGEVEIPYLSTPICVQMRDYVEEQ